jgi:hypothetical protein
VFFLRSLHARSCGVCKRNKRLLRPRYRTSPHAIGQGSTPSRPRDSRAAQQRTGRWKHKRTGEKRGGRCTAEQQRLQKEWEWRRTHTHAHVHTQKCAIGKELRNSGAGYRAKQSRRPFTPSSRPATAEQPRRPAHQTPRRTQSEGRGREVSQCTGGTRVERASGGASVL